MLLREPGHLLSRPLPLIIFFTILQLIVVLPSAYLNFDESMWQYIGRNWFRNGLVPYAGGVDNKSPLIFAVFGLSDKLFGVNYWFPRIVGALCQSAGIYYVYKIARHIATEKAALLSTIIYGLSLLWKSTDGASVSFTETYAITCIIISFFYGLTSQNRRGFFISGLIAGLGFGFRISAFLGIAAIFISSFRRGKNSAIFFLGGVLSCVALIAALFLFAGINLHDFLRYALTDNFGPGSTTDHNLLWSLVNFMNEFFYSELILFYPFVAAFFFFRKNLNFLTTWLICEFIGLCIIGTFATTHFKNLLPALSLMSGLSLGYLIENYKVPSKPVIIIVWIVFFPKLLNPFFDLKRVVTPAADTSAMLCAQPYQEADDNSKKELGLWIKSNTNPGEQVFVAGYGSIVQAYSERQSPTIYFNVTQTMTAKKRLFADLESNKPAMIVIPASQGYHNNVNSDIRMFIDSLVLKNYSFERCRYGYQVYRFTNMAQVLK
ncbi:MAG: glycosyltransferase family 39 protein [Ginsengibacter sp.]